VFSAGVHGGRGLNYEDTPLLHVNYLLHLVTQFSNISAIVNKLRLRRYKNEMDDRLQGLFCRRSSLFYRATLCIARFVLAVVRCLSV